MASKRAMYLAKKAMKGTVDAEDRKDHGVDEAKENKKKVMSKSTAAKKAKKGADMGKKNNGKTTGFSAVEKNAAKEGYSKDVQKKIAGKVFWNMRKKGSL